MVTNRRSVLGRSSRHKIDEEHSKGHTKMAIAPLPQRIDLEESQSPWPQPSLRLVDDPRDRQARSDQSIPIRWKEGRDVSERRQLRAARAIRRRRIAVAVLVLGFVVLLTLPLRALGTITVSGQQTPGGTPAGLMDGTVYVVQAGDTLGSIAHELNPTGDQRSLVAAMASEIGSHVVVPGEHLVLP